MKTRLPAFVALGLCAILLASCSESEGTGNEAKEPDTILRFATEPGNDLAYTSTKASTKPGYVAIEFNNPQATRHNVAFEDSSGRTIGETDKIFEIATVRILRLDAGEYKFYCSLGNHREAGMEGVLVVDEGASTDAGSTSEASQLPPPELSGASRDSRESDLATRAPKAAWERTEPKINAHSGPIPKTVVVKNLIDGTGAVLKDGDLFEASWTAVYYKTGKWRESSWDTGEKYTFNYGVDQIVEGWEEGLKKMRVGGRRELIVPSNLAYDDGAIVYVIDLLSIN